jgi:hypothetical protein
MQVAYKRRRDATCGGEFIVMLRSASGTDRGNGAAKRTAPRLAAPVIIPSCLSPHPIWRIPHFGCDLQAVCYSLAFCEPHSSTTLQANGKSGAFAFIRSCRLLSQLARRPRLHPHASSYRPTRSARSSKGSSADDQHRRLPNRVCAPGPRVPSAGAKAAIAWFTLFPMRLNCKSKETA